MKDKYLTRQEVAEMLKISQRTIVNWERKGIVRPVKVGRAVRYVRSEVEELFN